MNTINIAIPSLPENIRAVESFIDTARERFHLDDDLYGNIMIAVTESVSNAIAHGNKKDRNKSVDLSLAFEDSTITFTIEDQGEGFDYNNLPDPTEPENIAEPSGRGIFLMKHLCDEVHFKDEGRIVQLTFYLS